MTTAKVNGCCPLDCQDSCAWTAEVEDGRVIRVEGRKDHPITRGVLCAKVKDYEARLTAPDRLLYPMKRIGAKGEGRFERISWDEALETIATRFKGIIAEHGAEALMPFYYLGSMGVVQRYALLRVFHALGASQAIGNVCGQSASAVAGEGHPIGIDPEEAPEAKLILLWGQNTLSTGHHQWHFLEEARKRGARLIAIDPRCTRTARQCDEHIAIAPGTDAILAAAMSRVMIVEGLADLEFVHLWVKDFETYRAEVMDWPLPRAAAATGIAEETIVELARAFAAARPALIRSGIAPMQTAQGEAFVRHLSALAILGGHWRLAGGGLSLLSGPDMPEGNAMRADLMQGSPRPLDMARLGDVLEGSPPVKGLMVWSANPAVTQIDQARVRRALAREDLFLAVHDHFITDTARYADIVLPATTQFEHFDVQGAWGHHYVLANRAAVPPMGEARSGGALMRGLAAKLGLNHPALQESDEEVAASALPEGWTLEDVLAEGWKKSPFPRPPVAALAEKLFLASGPLAEPLPRNGALQLLTPKSHYFLNSTFANMPRQRQSQGAPRIEINSADATRLGLSDGDLVIARSPTQRMRLALAVTDANRPGVAVMEGKWWGADDETSPGLNRLTPSRWSPAGQPAYNETWVTLERAK